MAIEPVTELGSGVRSGCRARVVSLSAPPPSYAATVERYLTVAGIAKFSARIYRISLTTWGMLAGERALTGPARRGAKPPFFPVAAIDDPAPPDVPTERAEEMDADTVNRELSIARKGDRLVAAPGLDPRQPDDRHRTAAGAAGPHQGPGREPDRVHRQSGTAQLSPQLIARRTR